jgi:N-acetylglucosamine-6-phosphate deacetylase
MLIIDHADVVLIDRILTDATVVCQSGRIVEITCDPLRERSGTVRLNGRGCYLTPGFIDIHVHGGDGADFMDGTIEAFRTVCRAHSKRGTTTIFPTSATGSPEQVHDMLEACKQARQTWTPNNGSRIEGAHLYGPYFAPDKVGCHNREARRDPSEQEYASYFAMDVVRIATCAAELPGADSFYQAANVKRCLITCGHSDASWPEMEMAFANGMRHVDHFWCAMSTVPTVRSRLGVPMRGSMLEFVLGNSEMSTEVIADGCHLAPELLDFAYRMKGPERLCLVTDANRALGMPPGTYRFGSAIDGPLFESDGRVGWSLGRGSLASSVQGMDHMVRQMKQDTSAPLYDIIRMASLTPAERTGIADAVGSITVGKRADLLLLNQALEVQQVIIAGNRWN